MSYEIEKDEEFKNIVYNNNDFFDANEINEIKDKIETMQKFNQIEVLRILRKNKQVTLNENRYGVHINLSELDKNTIDELKVYIDYVATQEINLNAVEQQKETFKNKYFTKDNKDISIEDTI